MSDFGEVRSLLHDAEPSKEAFDALVALFRHAGDLAEVEQVWLPYANEWLESWPDEIRALGPSSFDWRAPHGVWIALARKVDMSHCALGLEAIGALSRTEYMEVITQLVLRGNDICATAAAALGSSLHFGQLVRLDLSECSLGDEAIEVLFRTGASARVFASLEVLDLDSNELTDASAHVLPDMGALGLKSLSLMDTRIGRGWVEQIVGCPSLSSLEGLNLSGCRLGRAGVELLADAPHLALTSLELDFVHADERALMALVSGCMMSNVRELYVDLNDWTDDVTLALANSPSCRRLERIDVGEPVMSLEALTALATSPNLRRLVSFGLTDDVPHHASLCALFEGGVTLNPWAVSCVCTPRESSRRKTSDE